MSVVYRSEEKNGLVIEEVPTYGNEEAYLIRDVATDKVIEIKYSLLEALDYVKNHK